MLKYIVHKRAGYPVVPYIIWLVGMHKYCIRRIIGEYYIWWCAQKMLLAGF